MASTLSPAGRERYVSQIISHLQSMPKMTAVSTANQLYSGKELDKATDFRLKHELCTRLCEFFADVPAETLPARTYWESIK